MSQYEVQIIPAVVKAIERLEKSIRIKVADKIGQLAFDPRPSGCKKLKGISAYRIRIGDYRVVYEIKDKQLIVTVINAGHRKDIYNL